VLKYAKLLVVLTILMGVELPAEAKTGTYRVALVYVKYLNTTPLYSPTQLAQAASEIHDYFYKLSYQQLDVEVLPVEVRLNNTKEFYFNPCQTGSNERRVPCPPRLIEDASLAAAAGGFNFAGIDGIVVLNTFSSNPEFTLPALAISQQGVNGTFQRSYCYEHNGVPAPGPSGIAWGSWAHEIGHQLEFSDYGFLGWGLGGHPSNYSSGYDLMDSCYPCASSAYTLLDAPVMTGSEKVFSGWLRTANVVTVSAPSPGTTVVLTPIEETFTSTQASQAIQVPIAPGVYYLVEARHRLLTDALQNNGQPPQGIYDEGVRIVEVEETRDPPMRIINACDTTVMGGCVNSSNDPRMSSCNNTTRPAYCWPFALWHVGDTFSDNANTIQIKVESAINNGFAVTIARGVTPGHPNLFVVPWLTPPMNTYETIDLWVDSSCNGYESNIGPSGLLYGRRADGTVVGNGDDPCANHENRVYAHVRNVGDTTASNVVVRFQVSDPLGVGVTGSWSQLGQVTIPTLGAGAATDVFVNWIPGVSLTPRQIASGHFSFHSCIQAIVDAVSGEIIISDNHAQENFDNFQAVLGVRGSFPTLHERFYIHRSVQGDIRDPETYYLNVQSKLPKSWKYTVANGQQALTLAPGQTVQVPVDIRVPLGTPIGTSYSLSVQAFVRTVMTNPAIPANSGVSTTHGGIAQAGGVVLSARAVLPDKLSILASADAKGNINASGAVSPAVPTLVAVDFIDPDGNIFTRLAHTDASGKYTCSFAAWHGGSTWTVRSIWHGDMTHSSAVSSLRMVSVTHAPLSRSSSEKVEDCKVGSRD
jgi:hypothetical protein